MGKTAATTVVTKAELAQSYNTHARSSGRPSPSRSNQASAACGAEPVEPLCVVFAAVIRVTSENIMEATLLQGENESLEKIGFGFSSAVSLWYRKEHD